MLEQALAQTTGGRRPAADTLDVETGRVLINASQRVRARAPFLLVLTGTPGVERHLSRMDASFWDRSRQLYPGLLSEAATRRASAEPDEIWAPGIPSLLTFTRARLRKPSPPRRDC